MQMLKNILTFLRHNLFPSYYFLLPWSLHCLRRRFHAKRLKFLGICQPSATGCAIVCGRCVLMGKRFTLREVL